ncbi:MAG: hypothetical protein JSR65_02970 [Proteobacteria bacterium]|nr:hypothetical protein [Pseudomonadota bacterium]
MSLSTQIKSTLTILAVFAAFGFAALTRAQPLSELGDTTVLHTRILITAPDANASEESRIAHVRVGTPIAVGAQPTAKDIERASR